jgi:hypothetical protein
MELSKKQKLSLKDNQAPPLQKISLIKTILKNNKKATVKGLFFFKL